MSSCEQQDVNGNFSISSQYYHSPNHANDDSSNGDTKIKPKRPRTAYNYFFSEERTKILSIESPITELEENKLGYSNSDFQSLYPYENQIVKLSDAAAHMSSKRKYSDEKVSFEKIGKMIGQRWKSLSPKRAKQYQRFASIDTERYKKEMKDFHEYEDALLERCGRSIAQLSQKSDPSPNNESSSSVSNIEKNKDNRTLCGIDRLVDIQNQINRLIETRRSVGQLLVKLRVQNKADAVRILQNQKHINSLHDYSTHAKHNNHSSIMALPSDNIELPDFPLHSTDFLFT